MRKRTMRPVEVVAGNVAGADPHRKTVSVTVLDPRGGVLGTKHFKVSGVGHRAWWDWVSSFGPLQRFGVENASGIGRHTATFRIGRGVDVRDVCPTRTAEQARRRREGKSDALDATRIARETLAESSMSVAFKRAGADRGPDPVHEQILVWHKALRSLVKSRVHLLNEADRLIVELRLEPLPRTSDVRRMLRGLRNIETAQWSDPVTVLRLRLLADLAARVETIDRDERAVARELAALINQSGSSLNGLGGLADRSTAELLAEVGDPRRFTDGGFARFNGCAPLPCSSGEGGGQPVRHRFNPGGNRRVNAVLHHMATTQLRCQPRARQPYDQARQRGHTNTAAMRILKRRLSDVVYRCMIRDVTSAPGTTLLT